MAGFKGGTSAKLDTLDMYILVKLHRCRKPAEKTPPGLTPMLLRAHHPSAQDNGQNHNGENDCQDEEQAAALVPRGLLVPRRLPRFHVCLPRVVVDVFYIVGNGADADVLLVDDLGHLPEQDVEVPDTLLDIADLFFPLDDERFLEVDLVLWGKLRQLVLLLLVWRGARLA